MPKNVKGRPFGLFAIPFVAKPENERRGEPFATLKTSKKSLTVPEKKFELGHISLVRFFMIR